MSWSGRLLAMSLVAGLMAAEGCKSNDDRGPDGGGAGAANGATGDACPETERERLQLSGKPCVDEGLSCSSGGGDCASGDDYTGGSHLYCYECTWELSDFDDPCEPEEEPEEMGGVGGGGGAGAGGAAGMTGGGGADSAAGAGGLGSAAGGVGSVSGGAES